MNDPHVVSLVYRIKHDDGLDYSQAAPLERDEQAFRMRVKDGLAHFEFREHHSTVEAAAASIGGYIRAWEFDAQLARGPDSFRLTLDRGLSEIIDRAPPPKNARISGNAGSLGTRAANCQCS